MSLKLSLLATHSGDLQRLSANVPVTAQPMQVSTVSGDQQSLMADINKNRPDVVVADFNGVNRDDLSMLEATIRNLPQTAFILLAADRSPEFLLNAMRIGVREIVPLPLINGELKEAVARQVDRTVSLSGRGKKSKTIAFVSAKGGSGATFLVTSLATALAKRGRAVGFFDLNLQFGDAIVYLTERQPTVTLSDLARQIDRADADFLKALMMPIQTGLWALPGPDTPERAMEIKPAVIEQIITTSRSSFDFTLLDIGRGIDAVSVKALDLCDEIYVVMQLSIPSIQDSKRLLNLMNSLGYPRDKVRLVANRVQKGGDIGAEDVQKALSVNIRHLIPNSWPAAVHTANHGISILDHAPKDPLSKAINELALQISPQEVVQAVPTKWLGQLFGARKPI
jgi:pilus assembly protein CpaE